jgi:hypothetical protein
MHNAGGELRLLGILRSSHTRSSKKFVIKVGCLGIKLVSLLLIFVMNAAKFIADSLRPITMPAGKEFQREEEGRTLWATHKEDHNEP